MKSFALQAMLLVVLGSNLTAVAPVIGTVIAAGAFRLNGDTVTVNGTLTEARCLKAATGIHRCGWREARVCP